MMFFSLISCRRLDYEVGCAALTIAHAILNPYRYADMVKCSPVQTKGSKQHAKLQKYFGRTKIGKIGLQDLLLGTISSGSDANRKPSWHSHGFCIPEGGEIFEAGQVTMSLGYFIQ
ncbi:hypothetical protein EDD22DRAFT_846608 [Suillus occidentalis]|nr:hypothetical protein EDD22DRAFT_846608 [Suillus occidentalis]